MLNDDRLESYRDLEGMEATLRRVSMRLSARTGRDLGPEKAVPELRANLDGLGSDFAEFLSLLRSHVATMPGAAAGVATNS